MTSHCDVAATPARYFRTLRFDHMIRAVMKTKRDQKEFGVSMGTGAVDYNAGKEMIDSCGRDTGMVRVKPILCRQPQCGYGGKPRRACDEKGLNTHR